MLSILVNL
ncbi:hypothetical protein VCHENC02_1196A, partial [Vibrio harveyi]